MTAEVGRFSELLRVARWKNGGRQRLVVVRMLGDPTYIDLQDGMVGGRNVSPTAFVMNVGRNHGGGTHDDEWDFFLHYNSTTWTPYRDQNRPRKTTAALAKQPTKNDCCSRTCRRD